MKNLIFCISLIFFAPFAMAVEITVIKLHNKSIDQLADENLIPTDEEDAEEFFGENNSTNEISMDNNSLDLIESDLKINEIYEVWDSIEYEDIVFLLNNIKNINSNTLKNEILSSLNINNKSGDTINKEDYDKLIIDSLLSLGDMKKSYELIKTFKIIKNPEYNIFYKKFILNYLLSSYNLSESCDYRNQIKNLINFDDDDFFLKIDIFCLILEEKFDEANLLNALLIESPNGDDKYFQYLLDKLQKNEIKYKDSDLKKINNYDNIFLYSAMNRIANLPLTEKFLESDPLNLSMPIVLSGATKINLRLKAAHIAYSNKLLNEDSLAALYQAVDFSYEQLNNTSEILPSFDDNIEIGIAYFFQLINIQLLPITRLEAILRFWDFAEKNNLELIAYKLSFKYLNTIDPTNELSEFGPKISRAYIYNNDFERSKKWLTFSENYINNDQYLYELNSSKLLYNLFNIQESFEIIEVLVENLKYMNQDLIDKDSADYIIKAEILNLIFSTFNDSIEYPYQTKKNIVDSRPMVSAYMIDMIKNSIKEKNNPKLLLAIVASLDGKKWNEIHSEHFRLILTALKEYKNGLLLNTILLEILDEINVI